MTLLVFPYFEVGCVAAFIAVILFFHINSAAADKIGQPKGNRIFLYTGIFFVLVTLALMYMVKKLYGGGES